MRKLLLVLFLLGTSAPVIADDTHVQGYHRKDGTYVAPHYRAANGNSHNNSTKGNANPYAGNRGTVDPYRGSGSGNNNGSGFGRQPGVLGSSSVPVGSPLWSPAGIRKAGPKVNAGLSVEHQPTR